MDHHSILDRGSALAAVEGGMPGTSPTRSATAGVSAGAAAAKAHLPWPAASGPRFPGEDSGRSLSEMASSDLDAALQLLAERAQYITGATGAAIALRRGQHSDMLCRASVGSNAPELGALLSMEYGLSGESVRTHKALHCDDAERDPRVNREGCRQLGIASVVVMPIVSDQQVLGVFELFSGKPKAFEGRDISALQRMTEMVEVAVKHAVATQTVPAVEKPAQSKSPADTVTLKTAPVQAPVSVMPVDVVRADAVKVTPLEQLPPREPEKAKPALAPKKPLFWSAAMQTQGNAGSINEAAASTSVPPVLRNLQQCQACGFPVSQGRTFCVECEERQWRGQRLPMQAKEAQTREAQTREPASAKLAPGRPVAVIAKPAPLASAPIRPAAQVSPISVAATSHASGNAPDLTADFLSSRNSTPFLGSAAPSESWFAANKYVLGALLIVAVFVAAVYWLR
jgi:GAF domain